MEMNGSGKHTPMLDMPFKNFGNTIAHAQESAANLLTSDSEVQDELAGLAAVECELSIAGMQLERGLRRPEQRDAFEACILAYREQLETQLKQELDTKHPDHQEDYIRHEIVQSASRVMNEEMTLRRTASRYERTKASIAETKLRRIMGSAAVATGIGAGMYWGIDAYGGAAATGGVLTFYATKGQLLGRISKSVVVGATRSASKQVSHHGAQLSQGVISEHMPGEFDSTPMPAGVAETLQEIEKEVALKLINPERNKRLSGALDATMNALRYKYSPPPLKEVLLKDIFTRNKINIDNTSEL